MGNQSFRIAAPVFKLMPVNGGDVSLPRSTSGAP